MLQDQPQQASERRIERLENEIANQRIKAANTVLIAATVIFAIASVSTIYQGWVGLKGLESLERTAQDRANRIDDIARGLDQRRQVIESTIETARSRTAELKAVVDSAPSQAELARFREALTAMIEASAELVDDNATWSEVVSLLAEDVKPAPSVAREADLDQRLQAWIRFVGTEDYVPEAGVARRGSLEESGTAEFAVSLNAGTDYKILGLCDTCGDLDLTLLDSRGGFLGTDTLSDTFPVVEHKAEESAGPFMVEVHMYRCSEPSCPWAVSVFRKQ